MKTWFSDRSSADDQAAVARFALIASLSLLGVIGLYFGMLYLITH